MEKLYQVLLTKEDLHTIIDHITANCWELNGGVDEKSANLILKLESAEEFW